jgi:phosphoribosylamine-glycine ligase
MTMDFVVVAPDDPLALGMVDALEAKGIPAFGPGKRRCHRGQKGLFTRA